MASSLCLYTHSCSGITVGRLVLIQVNKKVSEDHAHAISHSMTCVSAGWRAARRHLVYPYCFGVSVSSSYVVFCRLSSHNRMQLIIWFTPSLIGNSIAVSFSGVFLGPLYPIVMNQAGLLLPPRLLFGSISWIGGFGQAGSAFMPFITGTLASSKGIQSIQPLYVSALTWTCVINHLRIYRLLGSSQ